MRIEDLPRELVAEIEVKAILEDRARREAEERARRRELPEWLWQVLFIMALAGVLLILAALNGWSP